MISQNEESMLHVQKQLLVCRELERRSKLLQTQLQHTENILTTQNALIEKIRAYVPESKHQCNDASASSGAASHPRERDNGSSAAAGS